MDELQCFEPLNNKQNILTKHDFELLVYIYNNKCLLNTFK